MRPSSRGAMSPVASKARAALAVLALLFAMGVVGYRVIEQFGWLDSFYMTVITLSTVGFGGVHPLSQAGKAFTSVLILLGVGTLAYAATKATEAIIEGGLLRRRRMLMEIKRLRDHVIVCGWGRMGAAVTNHLAEHGAPHVVIEKDPERLAGLESAGIPHVAGDATEDATLQAAGAERAKALAAVLSNDAENLFVTVTARSLNRNMTIVARASTEKNQSKLLSAGATRVFNPYLSGGRLLATQLLQPSVTAFMEMMSHRGESDLALEELQLDPGSPLVGVTLRDAPIRRELDVIVVGVRRRDDALVFNPPPDLAPEAGDVLVALGRRENLVRLARLAEGPGS